LWGRRSKVRIPGEEDARDYVTLPCVRQQEQNQFGRNNTTPGKPPRGEDTKKKIKPKNQMAQRRCSGETKHTIFITAGEKKGAERKKQSVTAGETKWLHTLLGQTKDRENVKKEASEREGGPCSGLPNQNYGCKGGEGGDPTGQGPGG